MLDNFSEYGYLGVFLALVGAGLGFPIPEELPVLTAGVLCGHADTLEPGQTELPPNRLKWWIMLPVCIIGIVICDGFLYGIGRLWGARLLRLSWVQRNVVTPEKRVHIERNIHERGLMILLGARLVPGIRSPIFVISGMLRMPLGRFLLADGLYAIPGVSVLFWLAYFLTDHMLQVFHNMQHAIDRYKPLVIVSVLSAIAGALFQKYVLTRRVSLGDPVEVPKLIAKPAEVVVHAVEKAVEKVGHVGHLFHHDKPAELHPPSETGENLPEPSGNGGAGSAPVAGTPSADTCPPVTCDAERDK